MSSLSPLGSSVASAAATALLLPPLIGMLRRRQILDTPGRRSSHAAPTPRGGGAALVAAVAVVSSVAGAPGAVIAMLVAFAVVGGIDDLGGLAARTRLGLQVLLSLTASTWLFLSGSLAWSVAVIAAVFLVVYVNAFNFMDGINGISGLQVVVVAGACMVVGLVTDSTVLASTAAAVLGAAAVFLPFNFPHAKVFLGDVGSYGIGALLALLLVLISVRIPVWAAVLVPAVYLVDVFSTLIRRTWARAPLMEAHREHVYQRLLITGWSHVGVSAFVTACSALVAAAAVAAGLSESPFVRAVALFGIVVVLGAYLGAPRCYVRWIQSSARSRSRPGGDALRGRHPREPGIEPVPASPSGARLHQ